MKVAVVIVNYNNEALLKKCLISLNKVAYSDLHLIVVDNGSEDLSTKRVKKDFPKVDLIELNYNSGFCRACNLGISRGLEKSAEAVILLNNDTEVDSNFVTAMIDQIDLDNRYGMVAAKVLNYYNRDIIDSAGLMITPDGLGKNRYNGLQANTVNLVDDVFCPTGSAALYIRTLLEDVVQNGQYLDEDFVFYLEELDLGWRARLRGWKCRFAPQAIVYHHKRATTSNYPEKMLFYANRNIYFNIIKNYSTTSMMIKAIILTIVRNIILLLFTPFKKGILNDTGNKVGMLRIFLIFFKSSLSVLYHLKAMTRKRKIIQSSRIIENKEILNHFRTMGFTFLEGVLKR